MDLARAAPVRDVGRTEPPLQLRRVGDKNKDPEADEYDPFDHREVEHPLT